MYTKAKIFNLALGALLLNKRIADVDNDTSTENRTLNVHYETALRSTLEDLDLDSTSTQKTLELIDTDPNDLWLYAYKYPSNCTFFRRIQTAVLRDDRRTRIPLKIASHNGVKAIFTNEADAIGEYIPSDVDLSLLNSSAGLAVAYKLAQLSAPLIVGKGAAALRKELQANYIIAKTEAQEHDKNENLNFEDDDEMSEFVAARIE